MTGKTVLVTGASRGLGKGVAEALSARGWKVIVAARRLHDAEAVVDQLASSGGTAQALELDVAKSADLERIAQAVSEDRLHVDALVNNAGVYLDTAQGGASFFDAKISTLEETWAVNVKAPFRLMQIFGPAMRKHGWGRIVNVSSGMGGLSDMGAMFPAYRSSKTALNALTRIAAHELAGTGVLVNAVCPGWVKTDMGGANAVRELSEGVASILFGVELPDGGPTGGFFRDGEAIAW